MNGRRARALRRSGAVVTLGGAVVLVTGIGAASASSGQVGPSDNPDSCAVYIQGFSGESYYPAGSDEGTVVSSAQPTAIPVLDNDCVNTSALASVLFTTTAPVDADGRSAGTVLPDADKNLVFTPAADFSGDATFTYSWTEFDPSYSKPHESNPVLDGNTYGDTAVVTVHVDPGSTPVPDPTCTVFAPLLVARAAADPCPSDSPTSGSPTPDPTSSTPDPVTSSPSADPTSTAPTTDPDPTGSAAPTSAAPSASDSASATSGTGTAPPTSSAALGIGGATSAVRSTGASAGLAQTGSDISGATWYGAGGVAAGLLLVFAGRRRSVQPKHGSRLR